MAKYKVGNIIRFNGRNALITQVISDEYPYTLVDTETKVQLGNRWKFDDSEDVLLINEKGNKMNEIMNTVKDYVKQHKDTLITIGVLALVDQLVFDGKFRERLVKVFENLLERLEKSTKKE